jgi:hypothetical protein
MKKKATCVVPKPEKSSEIHYEGKEAEIWLGEIKNGLKVFFSVVNKFVCLDKNLLFLDFLQSPQ